MKQMNIIKRSGEEKPFDIAKIENAIRKASQAVDYKNALSEGRIKLIAEEVAGVCEARDRAMTVEEIQDVVETKIMEMGGFEIAKKYITYRYKQNLLRQSNTTDAQILSLIECNNEDVKQENSNKNPTINSVQRDYMAGEVSKDVAARLLLPPDIPIRGRHPLRDRGEFQVRSQFPNSTLVSWQHCRQTQRQEHKGTGQRQRIRHHQAQLERRRCSRAGIRLQH